MDNDKQTQGEIKPAEATVTTEQGTSPAPAEQKPQAKADNPTATPATDTEQPKEPTPPTGTAAKELSEEQFTLYNDTLRRVSKTAKSGLDARYNAFEDGEVKALVKKAIIAGDKPDAKGIAASVITRLTPKEAPRTETKTETGDEVKALKAELALVKAGIVPERLEAAKSLFIAEGGDPAKAAEFAAKYPEWQAGNGGGVTFTRAAPVGGKTAPAPKDKPVLTDFERKVAAARKARGLD